jgi:hypothetical protein
MVAAIQSNRSDFSAAYHFPASAVKPSALNRSRSGASNSSSVIASNSPDAPTSLPDGELLLLVL